MHQQVDVPPMKLTPREMIGIPGGWARCHPPDRLRDTRPTRPRLLLILSPVVLLHSFSLFSLIAQGLLPGHTYAPPPSHPWPHTGARPPPGAHRRRGASPRAAGEEGEAAATTSSRRRASARCCRRRAAPSGRTGPPPPPPSCSASAIPYAPPHRATTAGRAAPAWTAPRRRPGAPRAHPNSPPWRHLETARATRRCAAVLPSSGRRCCHRRVALLSSSAGGATVAARRCCHRRSVLLRRCCRRRSVLLP